MTTNTDTNNALITSGKYWIPNNLVPIQQERPDTWREKEKEKERERERESFSVID